LGRQSLFSTYGFAYSAYELNPKAFNQIEEIFISLCRGSCMCGGRKEVEGEEVCIFPLTESFLVQQRGATVPVNEDPVF